MTLRKTPAWLAWAAAWLSAAILFSGIVVVVLHVGEFGIFVESMREASPFWLGAALLCQLVTYACAASVWLVVIRRSRSSLPFASLFRLAFIELFANQAMPTGGLSGSVMVVHGLTRRGIATPLAMRALLLATLSYFIAYMAAGVLALAVLMSHGDVGHGLQALFTAFILVIGGLAVSVVLLSRARGDLIPAAALRWPPLARMARLLDEVDSDPFRDPALLAMAVALQFSVFLLDSATLWCACLAVGVDIAAPAIFTSFVFASVVGTLSPLPLGLGTFEGTCVGLLHLMGGGVEASLAATLILRGLALWLPMLPGLWLVRTETATSGPGA